MNSLDIFKHVMYIQLLLLVYIQLLLLVRMLVIVGVSL